MSSTAVEPTVPTTSLVATPQLLVAKLRPILQAIPDAAFVGIRADRLTSGPTLQVDGRPVAVAWAEAPLAVREVLRRGADVCTVIVTSCREEDLGHDVMARLARGQLLTLDRWQDVKDLFRAHGIDPRIVEQPGLLDVLLDLVPPQGYSPVTSGLLDLDSAWRAILRATLGVQDAGDLVELLTHVQAPQTETGWSSLPAPLRQRLKAWLHDHEGAAAAAIVGTLDLAPDRTIDPVAVGLVASVVLSDPDPADPALDRSAVRLEPLTGGLERGDPAAQLWADAAEAVAGRLQMAAHAVYVEADALLDEIGAGDHAWRSGALPRGYEQRLRRCAESIDAVLDASGPAVARALDALAVAVEHAAAHDRAEEGGRTESVRMAARLARRLHTPPKTVSSFVEAARGYMSDGGWADLAYARVWAGESDKTVIASYGRLLERAAERRADDDRRFGELLADWVATGGGESDLHLMERILDEVVAPLVETTSRVLLLVLDGMSSAAAAELFPSLVATGWTEWLPAGTVHQPVIPPFPTVTRICRTSLLSGELVGGDASTERSKFARHPRLAATSPRSHPPLLFHKADIDGSPGAAVDEQIIRAIEDEAQPVVAIVVNAIDDHLAKGQQIAEPWSVGSIGPLPSLLRLAAATRRVVVITADHGHVVDRGMTFRRGSEGERWRTADGTVADDEVVLEGPRVLEGGGKVVVPWSDAVRYAPRKHGYHGGASPAEVVVPLGIFATDPVDGWEVAPERRPDWWEPKASVVGTEAPAGAPSPPLGSPSGSARRRSTRLPAEGTLFDTAAVEPAAMPATAVTGVPAWIAELFATDVYTAQEQRAGRTAVPRERVARILGALAERGGTLTLAGLARSADIPPPRLRGFLAGLSRLLNVDGYAVVDVREDSVTLDRATLSEQFGLGT